MQTTVKVRNEVSNGEVLVEVEVEAGLNTNPFPVGRRHNGSLC